MRSKRPKVEPISQPALFQLRPEFGDFQQQEPERANEIPGILLGTSSFTAKGWERVFYPQVMRSQDFLAYYAKQF